MEDEAAAAAATMVSLPEDIVREILVRVENMAAPFRCAVTCKRWNHLIADASFLRRRWPDDQGACRTPSAFLAGFFTQERRDRRGQILGTFFVPTPRSVFGPGHRSLGSFFPDAAQARLLDRAVPLTARRGLLLVRLTAEDPLAYDYEYELRVCLAMCNPLAGVCDVLPPLSNTFEFNKSGYAILTSADCSSSTQLLPGYPTFFKVLIMGVLEHGRPPHLYTFSSGEARWSTPTVLSFDADPEIRDYRPLRHPDGVVSRGKVHWSAGDWSTNCSKLYTLDVDAETYRVVSRTKLAVPTTNVDVCSRSYDEPQLSVAANGTLSVLFLPWSKLRLEICTRQDNEKAEDGATAGWLDTRLVKLKPPEPEQSETSSMYFSLLGEKSGTVLLKGLHRHMYIGDLGTGAMERMTGWVRGLNRHKLVLFEMDWPTFFVSRLGTRPVPVEACM